MEEKLLFIFNKLLNKSKSNSNLVKLVDDLMTGTVSWIRPYLLIEDEGSIESTERATIVAKAISKDIDSGILKKEDVLDSIGEIVSTLNKNDGLHSSIDSKTTIKNSKKFVSGSTINGDISF